MDMTVVKEFFNFCAYDPNFVFVMAHKRYV